MISNSIKKYDVIGISGASLCLIHCLLLPILTIIPFGIKDVYVDSFFACVAILVYINILKSEATKTVKLLLSIAIAAILFGLVLENVFHVHNLLIIFGGAIMIVAHVINFKNHGKN